jgi:hypothetical protein
LSQDDLNAPGHQCQVIADVSCDINGPIAATIKASTIQDPFFGYNKETGEECDWRHPSAIMMMTIDNLPCELPRDASEDFGNESMTSFNFKDYVGLTETTVVKHEGSTKKTLCFNENGKLFSHGQPIFIKSNGVAIWVETGQVKIGDLLLTIVPETGEIKTEEVKSINPGPEEVVYDIRTEDNQWFIVENYIVIS